MTTSDLVFIGDVHLDQDDPDVVPFCALIRSLAGEVARVVLLGDLFNLWIGSPEFEGAHHRAVLEAIAHARSLGTSVDYVEGNRDYRIATAYAGTRLDRVGSAGLDYVTPGGFRVCALHGDLVNELDRPYRIWRKISRSSPFWWAVRVLPRGRRAAFAEALERRLRASNLRFKQRFPETDVRRYGAARLAEGRDTVVLGHFHERHVLEIGDGGARGRVVVLPLWKDGRSHARIDAAGDLRFETFSG